MACDPGVASAALAACGPEAMAPVAFGALGVALLAFAASWPATAPVFAGVAPLARRLGLPVRSLVACCATTGLMAFLAGYYAALDMTEFVGFALIGAAIAQVFVWTPEPGAAHRSPV